MWSSAPWDFLKRDIYKKIQLYCIVNIIWQFQVKVCSLTALNETKSSQNSHINTWGKDSSWVTPAQGKTAQKFCLNWGPSQKMFSSKAFSCRACSPYNRAFVLEEPKPKQFGDTLHCYLNVLHFCCLFAGSWDALADLLRLFKSFFIC